MNQKIFDQQEMGAEKKTWEKGPTESTQQWPWAILGPEQLPRSDDTSSTLENQKKTVVDCMDFTKDFSSKNRMRPTGDQKYYC